MKRQFSKIHKRHLNTLIQFTQYTRRLLTNVKKIGLLPNYPASPGRDPLSVMSGFSISVQSAKPASPIRSCVSSSKKLMNFMHFNNSSTRNCDHHILLIMTGNAHKEPCHKLSLILVREQGLYIIKTDCSGKMVVAFTIKEINYLKVSLFCDIVLPLSCLYLWY